MARHVLPSRARPAAPRAARRAGDDYGRSDEPDWRTIDWGTHSRRARVAGADMHYVDIGEGEAPPVVLVHGLAGQWQNWLENIPRLSRERRVIAPDLPGFGLSEQPHERISIPFYGRCVEALCEQLELERVVLVGNSMGGFVASEVPIQFPRLVERLVLVSAAGLTTANLYRRPAVTTGRIAAVVTTVTAAQHRAMACRPGTRHLALSLVARHPGRLAPDVAWEGLMKGASRPAFLDAMRACLDYDFRDRLPEIACPTLIVWGEKDAVIPVRDAHEFARAIRDSRKVVMRDTGHVPMLERPVAFNRVLLEFLGADQPDEASEEARPANARAGRA